MNTDDELIRSDKDLAEDYRRGMEAQDRMIAEFRRDNKKLLAERDKLAAIREALGKIIVSDGVDAGTLLFGGIAVLESGLDSKCYIYDDEQVNAIANALVALSRLVKDEVRP